MQKRKGIVMKLSGPHAIVMTSDRQFLRIPLRAGMRIGQEVELPKEKEGFLSWRKIGLFAASIVIAAGAWQMTSLFLPERVSAYIAIDINPSLELAVDNEREVLQATPLNPDGEKLIVNLKLKGKPVETAVNELATEAAKQGYLKPDGEFLVTATRTGESKLDVDVLEHDILSSVQTALKQSGIPTSVGGVVVSESVREEAKSLGLSPGKYALYLQAKAREIPITIDDLKRESVSDIAVKHGKDMKEIVVEMKGDKRLEELLEEIREKKADTPDKSNSGNEHGNKGQAGGSPKDEDKNKEGRSGDMPSVPAATGREGEGDGNGNRAPGKDNKEKKYEQEKVPKRGADGEKGDGEKGGGKEKGERKGGG